MSTPYVTTRHRCDFCGSTYSSKSNATRHEKQCWKNPATRSCLTCAHFTLARWPKLANCAEGISVLLDGGPEEPAYLNVQSSCPLYQVLAP